MNNVFFIHQIQHNKTTNQWTRGIAAAGDAREPVEEEWQATT